VSTEESKATQRRIVSELNKGNYSIIDKLFAGDFIFHGPFGTEIKGAESFKRFVVEFVAGFPDFHMMIEDMIAEDDKVSTRFMLRGTHKGSCAGISATILPNHRERGRHSFPDWQFGTITIWGRFKNPDIRSQ
jgi:hypothetical protein